MKNHFKNSWLPCFWLAYLGLIALTVGLRWEHWALVGLILTLYLVNSHMRRWVTDFFPFAIFGVLYDLLRVYPKSWAGPIHVTEPYYLEVLLFSKIGFDQGTIPTNFFIAHNFETLDFITGIVYAAHAIIPIGFAIYLWRQRVSDFNSFRWAFFFMNIAAFITYVVYPAAPPWYVSEHGLASGTWNTPGSAAGLVRFDTLLGMNYFQGAYARNSWVFGAIPSMHAAFPLLVALYAHNSLARLRWGFYLYAGLAAFAAFAAFAAVYLNHHYFIDVLAGWSFAIMTYFLFNNNHVLPYLSSNRMMSSSPR